jgi:hypothetical protein
MYTELIAGKNEENPYTHTHVHYGEVSEFKLDYS